MYNGEVYLGHFGNHKWGYSKWTLTAYLKQFGIDPLEVKTKDLNILYTGRKVKHIPLQEINKWVIYAHSNKFGTPRDHMTVAEAKLKMDDFHKNLK